MLFHVFEARFKKVEEGLRGTSVIPEAVRIEKKAIIRRGFSRRHFIRACIQSASRTTDLIMSYRGAS
jgi:hypothetical protein